MRKFCGDIGDEGMNVTETIRVDLSTFNIQSCQIGVKIWQGISLLAGMLWQQLK